MIFDTGYWAYSSCIEDLNSRTKSHKRYTSEEIGALRTGNESSSPGMKGSIYFDEVPKHARLEERHFLR